LPHKDQIYEPWQFAEAFTTRTFVWIRILRIWELPESKMRITCLFISFLIQTITPNIYKLRSTRSKTAGMHVSQQVNIACGL